MRQQEQHDRCDRSPPKSGWMLGRFMRWLPLLVVLLLIPLVSPNYRAVSGERTGPLGGDFLQEWIGGRLVLEGHASQLYESELATLWQHEPERVGFAMAGDRYFPMVYPLPYYAVMTPLAMLPYPIAIWVWYALMAIALGLAIRIASRVVQEAVGHWLPVIAAIYAPLILNMNGGQKAGIILAIFASVVLLQRKNRPFTAGCVAGLLLFKPPLALGWFAVALVRRDFRFLAGNAVMGGLLAISSLLISVEATGDYARFLLGAADYIRTSGYDHAGSHSWYSVGVALFGVGGAAQAFAIMASGATVLLAAGAWPSRTCSEANQNACEFEKSRAITNGCSAATLAALLISPHLMTYDLTVLLLPWAWGLGLQFEHAAPDRRRRVLVWLFPFALAGIAPIVHPWTQVPLMPWVMLFMLIEFRRARTLSGLEFACAHRSRCGSARFFPLIVR